MQKEVKAVLDRLIARREKEASARPLTVADVGRLAGGHVKQAIAIPNPFPAIGRGLSKLFGRSGAAAKPATPFRDVTWDRLAKTAPARPTGNPNWGNLVPPTPAAAAPAAAAGSGRFVLKPGRAIASAAGLTWLGKNRYDAAQDSPDFNFLNPFTYGERPTEEQIFQRHMKDFNSKADNYRPDGTIFSGVRNMFGISQAAPIRTQITEALGRGDVEKAQALQAELDSGDFGGGPRLMGLNPFASRGGGYNRDTALAMQARRQDKYDTEMKKVGPVEGGEQALDAMRKRLATENLLPGQASELERQMEALQQRMSTTPGTETDPAAAIKEKMLGAGMRHRAFQGPKRPRPTAGGWQLGRRPQGVNTALHNPNDFRGSPWEAAIQGGGGGMFR